MKYSMRDLICDVIDYTV